MTRRTAAFTTAAFVVIIPGTVAGLVPWLISGWHMSTPLLDIGGFRAVGVGCILCGLAVLLDSFARFVVHGLGTPAPALPTAHLVTSGLYRHVRNPMYLAVTLVIIGQALLLGSETLVVYGLFFWIVSVLFVRLYEEPTLRRTFGAEYDEFRAHVPRWLPRITAWKAERR